MAELHGRGFDGTASGSALSVIDPPAGRENLEPSKTREAYRKLLSLPVYPKVPGRERKRLSKTMADIFEGSRHLHITDARRVYAAVARTIETPGNVADIRNALQRAHRENVPGCLMGRGEKMGGDAFVNVGMVLDMRQCKRVC